MNIVELMQVAKDGDVFMFNGDNGYEYVYMNGDLLRKDNMCNLGNSITEDFYLGAIAKGTCTLKQKPMTFFEAYKTGDLVKVVHSYVDSEDYYGDYASMDLIMYHLGNDYSEEQFRDIIDHGKWYTSK